MRIYKYNPESRLAISNACCHLCADCNSISISIQFYLKRQFTTMLSQDTLHIQKEKQLFVLYTAVGLGGVCSPIQHLW